MCPRDPEATLNIRLSDDYNITSVVKFPSKYWYFSQVSVKADFHPTITIRSLEFAFLQSVTKGGMTKIHVFEVARLYESGGLVWVGGGRALTGGYGME